ncbi:MAG: TMEM175 family protein, partial [Gemmatimonadaceae bacterium]
RRARLPRRLPDVAKSISGAHHPRMRDGDFRIRGKDISRVEGLSDAVFGFAITLLVISLEVPKSADEVLHAMRGLLPFAVTFGILFGVWRTQFTFFRRYGLEDNTTVLLTAVLLFVILFFIYPLKFVMGALFERILSHAGFPDPNAVNIFKEPHADLLMMTYGIGWFAVFAVFALMYRHAYSKRDELQLSEIEEFDTRQTLTAMVGSSIAGIVIAGINLAGYLMPEGKAADRVAWILLAIVVVLAVTFGRTRRRARAERRRMIAGLRTAVEA